LRTDVDAAHCGSVFRRIRIIAKGCPNVSVLQLNMVRVAYDEGMKMTERKVNMTRNSTSKTNANGLNTRNSSSFRDLTLFQYYLGVTRLHEETTRQTVFSCLCDLPTFFAGSSEAATQHNRPRRRVRHDK
jgi:hypothetical protein